MAAEQLQQCQKDAYEEVGQVAACCWKRKVTCQLLNVEGLTAPLASLSSAAISPFYCGFLVLQVWFQLLVPYP